ncbi:hypothetical protein J1605_013920 [Eschrichtius robustus]|uniref:Topoisomerase I C-terminal domain-containing protein n=1 Tax=Eschrichtius robustus TaxID=9764 RepID=A0AB34GH40_ESCRO|nr:hypothetical protein J1605_013920 [Eschrichtius robustus]
MRLPRGGCWEASCVFQEDSRRPCPSPLGGISSRLPFAAGTLAFGWRSGGHCRAVPGAAPTLVHSLGTDTASRSAVVSVGAAQALRRFLHPRSFHTCPGGFGAGVPGTRTGVEVHVHMDVVAGPVPCPLQGALSGVSGRAFLEKRGRLLEKLEEQLRRLSMQATDKEEGKQVALGTSKLNYLDPRISVAWCVGQAAVPTRGPEEGTGPLSGPSSVPWALWSAQVLPVMGPDWLVCLMLSPGSLVLSARELWGRGRLGWDPELPTQPQRAQPAHCGRSRLGSLVPRPLSRSSQEPWSPLGRCKRFGVPVEKIYNKTQREKFAWALDMAGKDFEF